MALSYHLLLVHLDTYRYILGMTDRSLGMIDHSKEWPISLWNGRPFLGMTKNLALAVSILRINFGLRNGRNIYIVSIVLY